MQDLKVAILQSNLHWENVEENLNMFSSQILAIGSEADLIVLPEMFNTGFTMSSEEADEQCFHAVDAGNGQGERYSDNRKYYY